MITHAWRIAAISQARLLTMVSPAGSFETFHLETTRYPVLPPPEEIAKAFAEHGMQVLGPPLAVD